MEGKEFFKFLIIGDSSVGKTSLTYRMVRGTFDENIDTTIGVEFFNHDVEIDNHKVKLQIWDTAGQEKYQAINKAYYRDAVGVFLVFSIDSHESFEHINNWITTVRQYCHPKAKFIVVGNKCDLTKKRNVTTEEATKFAEINGIPYIETSACTGANVSESFMTVARQVYKGVITNEIQLTNPKGSVIFDDATDEDEAKKKKGCC